jgi:chorismate mutase
MPFRSILNFSHRTAFTLMLAASFGSSLAATDQATQPPAQEISADAQKINHLLALIDQRLSIADEVAKSKWNAGTIIDDPEREKQQLESISAKATAMGVTNIALVEVFFQNQFEASKIIQTRSIMHWHSVYPADFKFKDAPDLSDDIRPKLDKLTPDLIAALQEVQPLLSHPGMRTYLFSQANQLIRNDVNGEARHTALMTFESE